LGRSRLRPRPAGQADLLAAVNPRVALEVLRYGGGRHALNLVALAERVLEAKALRVGREHDEPARGEQPRAAVDELGVIARDVEHALHALRAREGRRIEIAQVQPAGALGSLPAPPPCAGRRALLRGA